MSTDVIRTCPIIIVKHKESKDRKSFAGSRELFSACTGPIGEYLQVRAREQTNPREKDITMPGPHACLCYLHGGGFLAGKKNGKRATIAPPMPNSINHHAYAFLREWIDDDSEDYSDEGEPFISRYMRAVKPFIAWVRSFTRIRIPLGDNYVLIVRPPAEHSGDARTACLVIDEHRTMTDADVDQRAGSAIMIICKNTEANQEKNIDVKNTIGGSVDFVLHVLTAAQFAEEYENRPQIPDNVSHVLTVVFGTHCYYVLISPWTYRKTAHIWRSCKTFHKYYLFKPKFLLSQLFIQ